MTTSPGARITNVKGTFHTGNVVRVAGYAMKPVRWMWTAIVGSFISIILLTAAGSSYAAEEIALDEGAGIYPVLVVADFLEDLSGELTFEDVHAGSAAARFRPLDANGANFGYTNAAVWLRFRLRNVRPAAGRWVLALETVTGRADLYEVLSSGKPRKQLSGAQMPFGRRQIRALDIAFPLEIDGSQAATYYLCLESKDSLVAVARLWSPVTFAEKSGTAGLEHGIYYGVLVSMVVYNLFLYLFTRDKVYLSYVLFQLMMVLSQMTFDKLAFQYLWPDHPHWAARAEQVLGCAVMASGLSFVRDFLDVNMISERLHRLLSVLMLVHGVLGIASVFLEHALFFVFLGIYFTVSVCLIVYTCIVALRCGNPNARILLLAWSIVLASLIVFIFGASGLMPMVIQKAISPLSFMKIGSAVEAMLLSLGLANRINSMRKERERTQLELLELRSTQAQTLERQVEQRTLELSEVLGSLRAAQGRLIRQERLAALGRLVGGVAHEIGNPLNFALGGASELSRRLAMLDELTAGPAAGAEEHRQTVQKALGAAKNAVELVVAGSDRIKKIIDDLRSYVRESRVEPVPTDLIAGIESTLEIVRNELGRNRIQVVKRFETIPLLLCQPGQLNQVFINLLINSCKAMPDGGTITISAHTREGEETVEIVFSDTGPGVDPKHRDLIFEPFFTTRSPNEGTGLGLYVCQEIVARHGGEIWLEDKEQGATFVITLPRSPRPKDQDPRPA